MMRVLVCGGRDYDDRDALYAALDRLHHRFTIVIAGGAPGGDTLGYEWATARGIPTKVYPQLEAVRSRGYGTGAGA
jgi:hypothetical protein